MHKGRFPSVLGKILDMIDVVVAKRADLVIAISDELKQHMVAKGIPADHIEVVPGGYDPDRFDTAEPFSFREEWGWDGSVIGLVATISRYHRAGGIIRAFKHVVEQEEDPVYLAMIGPIAQPKYFHSLIKDLDLEGRVKLTGFVPHRLIPSMMKGFDIALSFYSPQGYDFDEVRLPYKNLEYLGAGVPILAGDNLCNTNVLTHRKDSFIVESNEAGIAEGMITLLRDGALREQLSEGARESARRYSFEHVSQLLLSIYRDQVDR
jgi:glycosyltransferase involved in cell wall biosynthesis